MEDLPALPMGQLSAVERELGTVVGDKRSPLSHCETSSLLEKRAPLALSRWGVRSLREPSGAKRSLAEAKYPIVTRIVHVAPPRGTFRTVHKLCHAGGVSFGPLC